MLGVAGTAGAGTWGAGWGLGAADDGWVTQSWLKKKKKKKKPDKFI